MDESAVAKRRWYRLFTSKSIWLPAVVGAGALLFVGGTAGTVIGAAGLGIAAAVSIWKLTGGKQSLTELAVQDVREEFSREHFRYLRSLQRTLRKDKDPRTGQSLRDLRDLYKRMQRSGILERDGESRITAEVKEQTQQLYQSCLTSLERSFRLWETAQDMTTASQREQLMASRENVVTEVNNSIQHLGKTLDYLQAVRLEKELPEDSLPEMQQELEQGLEVARRVQQRMDELEGDLRLREGV